MKKSCTIKLIPPHARSAFTFKLGLPHFVAIFLIIAAVLVGAFALLERKAIADRIRLKKIEAYNRILEEKIRLRNEEKKEMALLAGNKYNELHQKLARKEQEINIIWKTIGKEPRTIQSRPNQIKTSRGSADPLKIKRDFKRLGEIIENKDNELDKLKEAALSYAEEMRQGLIKSRIREIPQGYPCNGYISSGFGYRNDPFYYGSEFHQGVDIVEYYGAPIYAAGDGVVKDTGYMGGYGYSIEIDHRNGYTTFYAHLCDILVRPGQRIKAGEKIGIMGCSGAATGAHLHYEVRHDGIARNPQKFLDGADDLIAKVKKYGRL
ncbi:MAG: peptidoglycan DD-metalloendopeptidase family protein [Chloroflexi bacterium]|nr:peptidoglycan DD-metalloendopeptidase family protein [Chloroflexota bacterium]